MRNLIAIGLVAILPFGAVAPATAQSRDQTLADIRQELTVLNVEIQKLKRELSTTGSASGAAVGGSVLERVDALEAEASRLTSKTEELEFRINSVVRDGTNRIGDLEFRLVELEGGDVSKLGQTSTLGGPLPEGQAAAPVMPAPTPDTPTGPVAELAIAERADYEAAQAALDAGNAADAAARFEKFLTTYPGSPMQAQAELGRGKALDANGETTKAARAFLAAFSTAPDGPVAPEALLKLGQGLSKLGQGPEACTTLAEVGNRFPGAPQVAQAQQARASLGCQ
ncbi:tol-pal system protein YbgF [Pseudooceanicola nitratireducens]|jgi:tol-pal system protein YbgF|uniref:Cell division coordinator CpoB n=1 Tax=Pseudooceanicola nitratireducens TaxID=517719 RepID=A0A1I1NBS0_9RHOB|nr:tol-pal system protein YbgF [Pseudooceanicola nitratireducens]MBY6156383.1 tol-pal system protein YbgF [Pseudooceanicola nitratireducens]SEI72577.1 tol-pal system protein YbgF [Pseudooceanicola nitratireducens]SFC94816.1 tol-pal system protein YbgF [Pseudooceanicola nitratireducens]